MKFIDVITSRLLLIFPEISGKFQEILKFRKICNPTSEYGARTLQTEDRLKSNDFETSSRSLVMRNTPGHILIYVYMRVHMCVCEIKQSNTEQS